MKYFHLSLFILFTLSHSIFSAEDTRTGASVQRRPVDLSAPGKVVTQFNPRDYNGKYKFQSGNISALLELNVNKQFDYVIRVKQGNTERKTVRKGNWQLVDRSNVLYIRLLAWRYKMEFRVIKQGGYVSLENMWRPGSVYYLVR